MLQLMAAAREQSKMSEISVNLSVMFGEIEPYYCSNSIANLGEQAAALTWRNCQGIARNAREWFVGASQDDKQRITKIVQTCEAVRDHAKSYGAWDDEEIDSWSVQDCLAFLVQDTASELRERTNVDDESIEACELNEADDGGKLSLTEAGTYSCSRLADIYLGV